MLKKKTHINCFWETSIPFAKWRPFASQVKIVRKTRSLCSCVKLRSCHSFMCNSPVSSEEPTKNRFCAEKCKRWMKVRDEQKHGLPAHLMERWHWCFLAPSSPQVELYDTPIPSSTRDSLWGILWLFKSLYLCQVALGAMQFCAFLPVGLISSWRSCMQLERRSVQDYHNQVS